MKARIPCKISNNQMKAMKREINRQIIEHDEAFAMDSDATVLWVLHEYFGFGYTRLRRFWEACFKSHAELKDRYQFNSEEVAWLCRVKLKSEVGIDIEEWYKEADNEKHNSERP